MKLTTQAELERALQAIELLTGYTLADIAKMREQLQLQGEDPKRICLPLKEFKLLGMDVHLVRPLND